MEHDYSVAITVSYWHLEARYFMVEPSLLGWVFHIIDDASNRSRPFGALASAALSKLIRPVGFSRWPTWDQALASDVPVVLEVRTDPEVFRCRRTITLQQARDLATHSPKAIPTRLASSAVWHGRFSETVLPGKE